ncbi:hypothetical protein [Kutzneria kofuensis]|uniref:SH3 domain-containing protein n=1 Tax=Kutzneria kofuensis TaxID=103725 RepID=A0A7W9NLG6_9PSEU|nr:hypothetical protein [Kutzneria kofuensis]MBB5896754.1 hypothetical protein [Kutzneria kofuensis]
MTSTGVKKLLGGALVIAGGLAIVAAPAASAAPHYSCVTTGGVVFRAGPGQNYPAEGRTYRAQGFDALGFQASSQDGAVWANGNLQNGPANVWLPASYVGTC